MKFLYINLDMAFLFITGVLQMEFFNLSWSYFRVIEYLHIFGSILLIVLFIFPFLYSHIIGTMVKHKAKSKSGMLFGIVFMLLIVSGVYLFLVGNRGGDSLGNLSHIVHLYGSFVLLFLLGLHLKKFFTPSTAVKIASLLIVFLPLTSYSDAVKLTNVEYEEGVSRYHNIEWTNSTTCKACHPKIFKQWANSNHRHLADSNPYYMVLENLAGMDRGEKFRTWCMGCHNPSAVSMKQEKTTHFMRDNIMPDPLFVEDSQNLVDEYKAHPNRLEQGVSCIACHRITDASPKGNSSYTLKLQERKKYLYEDAHSDTKVWINQKLINANPKTHKEEYMKPLYKKSEYCASCHNEFLPHTGKMVVSTYNQWRDSKYNNPKNPKEHKDCIDCHMNYLEDGKYVGQSGLSTLGGKVKKSIKTHYFTGANHFLVGLKSKEHESQSLQLLKSSAKLDSAIKENKLLVGVTNVGAGHKLPTGASDFREMWLDITVRDRDGKVIFSSGKLDESGNIEKNSIVYNKVFGDKEGNPVGLLFWRYEKLLKDTRIDAGKRVQELFPLPSNAKYPLKAEIKLNFRIYPQWVTDVVKVSYPQLPNPPVVTIAKEERVFD